MGPQYEVSLAYIAIRSRWTTRVTRPRPMTIIGWGARRGRVAMSTASAASCRSPSAPAEERDCPHLADAAISAMESTRIPARILPEGRKVHRVWPVRAPGRRSIPLQGPIHNTGRADSGCRRPTAARYRHNGRRLLRRSLSLPFRFSFGPVPAIPAVRAEKVLVRRLSCLCKPIRCSSEVVSRLKREGTPERQAYRFGSDFPVYG
jgi:hypothetical protein